MLDNIYATSVIQEGECFTIEMQATVGNNYETLQTTFNNFRNIMKKNYNQQKVSARPKRQANRHVFKGI